MVAVSGLAGLARVVGSGKLPIAQRPVGREVSMPCPLVGEACGVTLPTAPSPSAGGLATGKQVVCERRSHAMKRAFAASVGLGSRCRR